ncbi:hypothetical protein FJR38_18275 [Anabaena sp. UHCC 0253]|nr:hypothetical protein [Anabaena sp. UHCC 0253]
MDALVYHRRSLGLPGLSVNWGPWNEGGMAARLGDQYQQRLQSQGITSISPEIGFQALADLLSTQSPQFGVFSINWSQFLRQLSGGVKMPLLETLVENEPLLPSQKSTFIQQLEEAAIETRQELLIAHIRLQIAKILGMKNPEQIGLRERLFDLGIDSLMAVELKNIIESSLDCSVRSTVLFDYPTLEALVNYLQNDVLSLEFSLPEQEIEVENDSSDRFQEMTQNDLAQLLSARLAALGNKNNDDFLEEDD